MDRFGVVFRASPVSWQTYDSKYSVDQVKFVEDSL